MPRKRSEAQKQADKKYEKTRKKRYKAWTMIVYPGDSLPDDWRDICSNLHLKIWISPEHDRDKWTKYDERKNPNHKAGELKKTHRHLMVEFPNVVSKDEVKETLAELNGTEVERVKDLVALVRYLIHLDDPNKEQYSENDIELFGGANLDPIIEMGKGELSDQMRAMRKYIVDNKITDFYEFYLVCDDCFKQWSRILDSHCYAIEKFIGSYRASMEKASREILVKSRQRD